MKRSTVYCLFICLILNLSANAQGFFRPGEVVTEPFIKVFGHELFFQVKPINDDVRAMMKERSMKNNTVAVEDLRYLTVLHRDAEGNAILGEMVCAASIADDLVDIFKELFLANYPIEKMCLIDHYGGDDEASMRDNNTSCFNQRPITAGGRKSKHSYGLAVDINPKYNPYYKVRSSGKTIIRPKGSEVYVNRTAAFPYKITKGDLCYRLFKQHGFRWGGEWMSGKDYQHFEKP